MKTDLVNELSSSELNQNRLLLVMGHPGIGKSTLCRQLADKGAFWRDRDEFIQNNFPEEWQKSVAPGFWERVTEAVEATYIPEMDKAIANPANKQVIVEWTFDHNNEDKASEWADKAKKAGRRIEVVMLFNRNILRGVESTFNRDFPDKKLATHPDSDTWLKDRVRIFLDTQQNLPRVFELYREMGMDVKLYETDSSGKLPYQLVADLNNGNLTVHDQGAFGYFSLKSKINIDADVKIRKKEAPGTGTFSYHLNALPEQLFVPGRLDNHADKHRASLASQTGKEARIRV